ncbi:MAG: hypothetical protein LBN40_03550 [Oscillospiraceae bacterium]|jgi:hypothetical protein|nr:hypothetical protein [Oscillospiraceae bacterium]
MDAMSSLGVMNAVQLKLFSGIMSNAKQQGAEMAEMIADIPIPADPNALGGLLDVMA